MGKDREPSICHGRFQTLSVRKNQVALSYVLNPFCVSGSVRNEIKDCILVVLFPRRLMVKISQSFAHMSLLAICKYLYDTTWDHFCNSFKTNPEG